MPCEVGAGILCPIFRHYAGAIGSRYHGEVCGSCANWKDTPADITFKERARQTRERPVYSRAAGHGLKYNSYYSGRRA